MNKTPALYDVSCLIPPQAETQKPASLMGEWVGTLTGVGELRGYRGQGVAFVAFVAFVVFFAIVGELYPRSREVREAEWSGGWLSWLS